mgnify:CR=1 FL=1
MERIGIIIRSHRIAKGLTQEELGNKVFVSKQAVSKWETGKTLPDIEMMRKLCDILEINKDEILGSTIEETKKSRRLFKMFAIISVILIFVTVFFGVGGLDYIERHTQSGIAYVSVFWDGELLTTSEYSMTSNLSFEDFENGYKADISYGEVRAAIHLYDKYNIEFGFVNMNNWHNVHIRLDIVRQNDQLMVRQTISYETDNNVYQVIVNENATTGDKVSVFKEGI